MYFLGDCLILFVAVNPHKKIGKIVGEYDTPKINSVYRYMSTGLQVSLHVCDYPTSKLTSKSP